MSRARNRLPIAVAIVVCMGCRRHLPPGQADIPPDVHAPKGMYADINPRWSHDGKRIAFMRARSDGHLQLHVVDEDLERPLPQNEEELVNPDRPYSPDLRRYCSPDTLAWSPDDREIAFERAEWFTFEDEQRLPGTGLWSLDTFTGRVTPLALHPKRYLSLFYYFHAPQWSPDGRYLAFVGEGINGQRSIFVRSIAAQRPSATGPRFDNYQDSDWPTWQPQPANAGRRPQRLIFRQGIVHPLAGSATETLRCLTPGTVAGPTGEIWRMRDRDYARLLPGRPASAPVNPRAGHLVWSADGHHVAFTLTADANNYERYEIWIMNSDGSGARRVSPHSGYLAPTWIDERHLGALTPHGNRYDVVVIDTLMRSARRLGAIDTADCDWSPDRTRIVYSANVHVPTRSAGPTTLRLFLTHIGKPRIETAAIR